MQLWFRFYEELNDFLPAARKKRPFCVEISGRPTVKDIIEGMGVPHTEVDLILVNSESVNFDHHPDDGDRISVYPVFESLDIKDVSKLHHRPLRNTRFITDAHLGKLTKYLRMLGFDTRFEQYVDDNTIVELAEKEKRIVLTRDRGLLKIGRLSRGYWIRNSDTKKQLHEVIRRFQLEAKFRPFTRCMVCNGKLQPVEKEKIKPQLPLKTAHYYNEYFQCQSCGKVYWKGSHYADMVKMVEELKKTE